MKIRWDGHLTLPPLHWSSVTVSIPIESVGPELVALLLGTTTDRARWKLRWWRVRRILDRTGWKLLHGIGRA